MSAASHALDREAQRNAESMHLVAMQVISTDMNRVVVELLQNLLFWQERSKAMNAHNAVKKKRLVSGLREVGQSSERGLHDQ